MMSLLSHHRLSHVKFPMSDILHKQILDLINKYLVAPPSDPNDSHDWVFSHDIKCDFDKDNLEIRIIWSCSECYCLNYEAKFGFVNQNIENKIKFMCKNVNDSLKLFPSQCSQTKHLMDIDQILNC